MPPHRKVPQLMNSLKKNWCLDKKMNPEIQVGLDNFFKQYKPPGNCLFDPPSVNKEVCKLLSAPQRSADVKFLSMLKSLSKTMSAVLEEAQCDKPDIGKMAQITTDVCYAW